tara:strand:- start:135 stop:353 length:219 start_codon:yes stop_codon:yes gene_type:complete
VSLQDARLLEQTKKKKEKNNDNTERSGRFGWRDRKFFSHDFFFVSSFVFVIFVVFVFVFVFVFYLSCSGSKR